VQRASTEHTRRSARWLLLACTLFGLATMHTLGHAGMQMHPHHNHGAELAAVAPVASTPGSGTHNEVAEPAIGGFCNGGCAHAPTPSPHDGMAGWGVCLAVLGAVAILTLLAMLVSPSRRWERPASVADPWAVVARGPPARPAGLSVAALSVLRV
jgi:hypothetical protein